MSKKTDYVNATREVQELKERLLVLNEGLSTGVVTEEDIVLAEDDLQIKKLARIAAHGAYFSYLNEFKGFMLNGVDLSIIFSPDLATSIQDYGVNCLNRNKLHNQLDRICDYALEKDTDISTGAGTFNFNNTLVDFENEVLQLKLDAATLYE